MQAGRFYITSDSPREATSPSVTIDGHTISARRSSLARPLTVRLDETTGAIASLRYDDHELVDAKAATALNDYFYLPGSDLKGLRRNGPVKISVKERGPLIASLLVESDAPGCRRLTREVRVHGLKQLCRDHQHGRQVASAGEGGGPFWIWLQRAGRRCACRRALGLLCGPNWTSCPAPAATG